MTLFGSRADDSSRGGDIDLLISIEIIDIETLVRAKIDFLVRVQLAIGEQKMDLIVDYPGRGEHPPIFEIAERTDHQPLSMKKRMLRVAAVTCRCLIGR